MFLRLLKYNHFHDRLGRFASASSEGAVGERVPSEAQTLYNKYKTEVTVESVLSRFSPEQRAKLEAWDKNLKDKIEAGQETININTPERLAARKACFEFFRNEMDRFKAAPGETPLVTFLGGRGGSGKSKLDGNGRSAQTGKWSADQVGFNEPGGTQQFTLDGDAVKEWMSKRVNHGTWNPKEAGLWHREADVIVDKLRAYARRNDINIALDITMKSDKLAWAQSFKNAGFDLKGAYMFASPERAAQQAGERALKGDNERYVPLDRILQNTKNEKNFDAMLKYFNKGYSIWDNMNSTPGSPAEKIYDTRTSGNTHHLRHRKGEYGVILKFNHNHDPDDGRFTTAGIANSDFTHIDRKIIDLKPDKRPLTDPKQVVTLAKLIPGSSYVPYTKLPFFHTLMRMQGTDIISATGHEQKAARDKLLSQQPVHMVPMEHIVFTQNVVHQKTVDEFAGRPGKPVQVAHYRGKYYLLDGHHRVAYEAEQGSDKIEAHVIELTPRHHRQVDTLH